VGEGRSRARFAHWGTRPHGCRWASWGLRRHFAVRVLALIARGFCASERELNLAHRRRRAPWLLVTTLERRDEVRRYESGDRFSVVLHSALRERAPHREHRGREIAQDCCGLDANDAIAGTRELAISAGVRRHAPRVIAAIVTVSLLSSIQRSASARRTASTAAGRSRRTVAAWMRTTR